ncbi:hypothetical protein M413DRAFT_442740 [Hebeloma cylindrosporum]|uniref:EngB-type G domain-containing protein n=1 Tax=Hebeloma cylindrosporum TaxID=76867 RepID=A0A0C2YUU3_HEBCY|nr:hypothetical protein M413DRAFT_442740 [Hebeloma cylindrosporum h7]
MSLSYILRTKHRPLPYFKALVSLCCPYSTQQDIWQHASSADFLAAAASISSIPKSKGLPEIIVTGRANVGKSTLLNSVLGRKSLLSTSKKAGHTKSLNFYRVGAEPGKLILVDAPGYGARGRPQWGELFDHYVRMRKELRRIYILFNAKHGLNAFDARMLSMLSESLVTARGVQPFTLQAIITKADTVPVDQLEPVIAKIREDIWAAAPLCLPPIVTSTEMSPPFGVDLVRHNIANACSL